jgi:Mn2+/Fe2+ NRAMP family transporter
VLGLILLSLPDIGLSPAHLHLYPAYLSLTPLLSTGKHNKKNSSQLLTQAKTHFPSTLHPAAFLAWGTQIVNADTVRATFFSERFYYFYSRMGSSEHFTETIFTVYLVLVIACVFISGSSEIDIYFGLFFDFFEIYNAK